MADNGNDQYPDDRETRERQWVQDRQRQNLSRRRAADVSGWHDRTPTGIRNGVDETEAEDLASRPRQIQRVNEQDRRIRTFTHTQFVAHINDRIAFSRNGDMLIHIQVPFQFKHLAEPLTDAFGIPLSFDVEVWAPYNQSKEEE